VLAQPPVLDALSPFAHRIVRDLPLAFATDASHGVTLAGLGNGFLGDDRRTEARASRRAGVVFFEDTALDAASIARARSYDAMIAGSTWNAELMKAFGVPNVHLVLQGVDHSIFHPAPRAGTFADRFVVFSGGKLEYRKGQDIVIEAFRRFHATHPDALLVTAWHNHWPQTLGGMDRAGYVRGIPAVREGRLQLTEWLVANGLPLDAFVDVGQQSQLAIAQILREADVAVFPNRCEGGTNLVAMEAMACGIPAILSANTGHLNLIGDDTCYALPTQRAVSAPKELYAGTDFWGDSDPDEIVSMLEKAYDDRDGAAQRGRNGAALMQQLPWSIQTELLLDVLQIGERADER
jgi:glycosyltransferase involved in cell wall biosynthesis